MFGAGLNRRRFLVCAGAGVGAAAGTIALSTTAVVAQKTVDEVPLDKLLARDDLPDLSIGSKDAKVTIVEYASMTCPACANFHNSIFPKLKEKYVDTGKVRFIMREFPLDQLAAAVSMLSRCAGEGKSIPFISVLFKTQSQWRSRNPLPKLMEISKQAGITKAAFEKCLDNRDMLEKLVKHRDTAGKVYGVNATPSFFVNGKRLKGGYDLASFDKVLAPLLK